MDHYVLTFIFNCLGCSCLCTSSISFFRHWQPVTGIETNSVDTILLYATSKTFTQVKLITSFIVSSLVGVNKGRSKAVLINSASRIETEQESSAALLCTLSNLLSGSLDSCHHIASVYITVALDLVCADVIRFYSLLKLVCPISGMRHVSRQATIRKLGDLS